MTLYLIKHIYEIVLGSCICMYTLCVMFFFFFFLEFQPMTSVFYDNSLSLDEDTN